jgi:hypothetical protein
MLSNEKHTAHALSKAMSHELFTLESHRRVGCSLASEATVQTPVLRVLKPRLEDQVLVMQQKFPLGIGQLSYEFQTSHGNMTYRSMPRKKCSASRLLGG